jgi:hypothetical protein
VTALGVTILVKLSIFPFNSGPGSLKTDGLEIANHPWWRVPMTEEKANQIVSTIQGHSMKRGILEVPCLLIFSNGVVDGNPLTVPSFQQAEEPEGGLGGGENNVFLIFAPGRRTLSRDESRVFLKKMLDEAYASETKFRKTGKGNTNLDVLLQDQMILPNEGDGFPQTLEEYKKWLKDKSLPKKKAP